MPAGERQRKRRSVVPATTDACDAAILPHVDVEMRHLRALLTLADELNFTRAAERLHLTQQALSGQIRQLEDRVGTRLVERDTRHVGLTPAGEALAAGTPAAVRSPARSRRRSGRGCSGGPSDGRLRRAAHAPDGRAGAAAFSDAHPDVELTIHFANFLDPLAGLARGAPTWRSCMASLSTTESSFGRCSASRAGSACQPSSVGRKHSRDAR